MSGRVAIVGAGGVGRTLGTNMIDRGIQVRYLVRDPDGADLPESATASRVDDRVEESELLLLAVPFGSLPEVAPRLDLPSNATVIDATNPFGADLPEGTESGAALVSSLLGDEVNVVKAFNVTGVEHMASPELPDGSRPLLPVAADDPDARAAVVELAGRLGFDPVDVGELRSAALLEEAARYWGLIAMKGGRGRHTVLVAADRMAETE